MKPKRTLDQTAEALMVDFYTGYSRYSDLCSICGESPVGHMFDSGNCLFVPGGRFTNKDVSWARILKEFRDPANFTSRAR